MLNIDAIDRAIRFIEDHLRANVTVADMAASVSYSLYHFCRTFNQVTHHTPYDYLMRRRLAEAARDLLQTDTKIIEIASDYRFNNPETFARAFRRVFGMLPSQWRKTGNLDPHLLMPRLTRAHLAHLDKGAVLKPTLEERTRFDLTGVITLVQDDLGIMARLWEWFATELENAAHARDVYSITVYPHGWAHRGFFYMVGIEHCANEMHNAAWVVKTLPAGTYARFTHRGAAQALSLTFDFIYHTWLPQSGWKRAHPWIITRHEPSVRDTAGAQYLVYLPIEQPGITSRLKQW